MSEPSNSHPLSSENQKALNALLRSIELSAGEFALLLPLCNYRTLQTKLVAQLKVQAPSGIQILELPQQIDSLYGAVQEAIDGHQPSALMITGLDRVHNIDAILAATNLVREEFRVNFRFPIWIWITDELQQKLIRQVPDIESWATPVPFYSEPDELKEFLVQTTERLYEQLSTDDDSNNSEITTDENLRLQQELNSAVKDLQTRKVSLDSDLAAGVEFALGQIALQAEGISVNVREHYERSAELWGELENSIRKGLVLLQLGKWWQEEALQRREEKEEAFRQAQTYLQQAKALFQVEQCLELEAKCIRPLGEVLYRLNQWNDLEEVAQQGLSLSQKHLESLDSDKKSEAYWYCKLQKIQGYRFLSDVALAKGQEDEAKARAEEALTIAAKLSETVGAHDTLENQDSSSDLVLAYERSASHFSLAKALLSLEQPTESLTQLELAREVGEPQYDPPLYIQVLRQLRQLYFEQKDFLSAFEIKQQYRSIERQYGLRAFVGAGRLESQKIALRPGLTTAQTVRVSQEIAASGRQQDVERLIERIGRTDCKLTVIYGQSGVGKSSLVQAGFIPAINSQIIDARRLTVVLQQVYTDWLVSLRQSIENALKEVMPHQPPPALETAEAIVEALRRNSEQDLLTILVFDQFEEFFFVCKDQFQRKPFYEFLQKCLNIPFVKVVLALREDYLHYLLECNRLENLEVINSNILDKEIIYYLGNFSKKDTKQVIESLTGQTAFYLQPDLIDILVNDLAGELDEVRPIELQVVGSQLQTEQIKTLDVYRERGPKEALVGRFLEEVVKDCGPEQEQITKLVLYLLTDENNTRPLKTRSDLELELDVEKGKLDLILTILVRSRLVFLIPSQPEDRYQLVHDYLVEFVRKEQSARLVQEIEKEREMRKLTEKRLIEVQKQELYAARRARNSLIALVSSISVFTLISVIAGLNFYLNSLRLAANQEWGPNKLVEMLKVAKMQKRISWLILPEIRHHTSLRLAETIVNMRHPVNILEGHTRTVSDIALHPQSNKIITSSHDRTVKLWDIEGTLLETMEEHSDKVTSVSVNHQGNLAASGSKDAKIVLWDLEKKTTQFVSGHDSEITALDFSTDGKTLISTDINGNIQISTINRKGLDITTQKIVAHVRGITAVDFSPDGDMFVSVDSGGNVKLWNLKGENIFSVYLKAYGRGGNLLTSFSNIKIEFSKTGREIGVLTELSESIFWMYDLTGNLIDHQSSYDFSSFFSEKIIQFDSLVPQIISYVRRATRYSSNVEISKDYNLIAMSNGNNVRIAKLEDNFGSFLFSEAYFSWIYNASRRCSLGHQNTYTLCNVISSKGEIWKEHKELVRRDFNVTNLHEFNGKTGATIFSDSKITLEFEKSKQEEDSLQLKHNHDLERVYSSPYGKAYIAVDSQGSIVLFSKQEEMKILTSQDEGLLDVFFDKKEKFFVVRNSLGIASAWNMNGEKIFEIDESKEELGRVQQVIFSPDGKYLVFVYAEGVIDIFDNLGIIVRRIKGYVYPTSVIGKFSPNSNFLVFSGGTNLLYLWDSSKDKLSSLTGHNHSVASFVFARDSNTLYSTDQEAIRVWNLRDNQLGQDLQRGYFENSVLALSPNSDILVARNANRLDVWKIPSSHTESDLLRLESVAVLPGIDRFSFSPDGKSIVFIEANNSIKILDLKTTSIKRLSTHDFPISRIRFSKNGKYLISMSSKPSAIGTFVPIRSFGSAFSASQLPKIDQKYIKNNYFEQDKNTVRMNDILKVWDLETGQESFRLEAADISLLSNDDTFKVFSPRAKGGKVSVQTLEGDIVKVYELDSKDTLYVSPHSEDMIFTTNQEYYLRYATVDGNSNIVGQHDAPINTAIFDETGKFIVSGSDDKTIKVWEIDGSLLSVLTHHSAEVSKLHFSLNGKFLASLDTDKKVIISDLTGNIISSFQGHNDIHYMKFSPNNEALVILDSESITLLELSSGKQVKMSESPASKVIFVDDGKTLVTFSGDEINFWNLDGKFLQNKRFDFGSTYYYNSELAMSSDQRFFVKGSSFFSDDSFFVKGEFWQFWRLNNIHLDNDNNVILGFSGDELFSIDLSLESLLAKGCLLAEGFMTSNPSVKESERDLCENILDDNRGINASTR